jgi:hypothetical protein
MVKLSVVRDAGQKWGLTSRGVKGRSGIETCMVVKGDAIVQTDVASLIKPRLD